MSVEPGRERDERWRALARELPPPEGLDSFRLRRVWRRLQSGPPHLPVRRGWLRPAVVAALLLLSGGVFAARGTLQSLVRPLLAPAAAPATSRQRSPRPTPAPAPQPEAILAPPRPPLRAERAAVPALNRPGRTALGARATTSGARAGGRARSNPPPSARPPALPASAPEPSALAREVALGAEAVRKLRRERDPAGALGALDEYDRRFPDGQLAGEADRLRAQALLALGRRSEALAVLRALALDAAADMPLRLIRAELLAPGACAEAVADFTGVIAGGDPALVERALRGRARCRARLGDVAGSARDRELCRRRFPDGPCGAPGGTGAGQ